MKKHILTSAIVTTLLFAAGSAFAAEINPGPLTTSDAAPLVGVQRHAPVDAGALQRAQAKFAHAMQVTNHFEAQASSEGFGNISWKYEMIANLMRADESSFASVEASADINQAVGRAMNVASVTGNAPGSAKALGSATYDLVYVPITPCRILDTRPNFIAAGATKTYNFDNSNVGGGSCSVDSQIPSGGIPAAEAINVTLDETGLTGFPNGAYIGIFPQGGALGTSFMNFGPNQIIANAGVISVNQTNGQFSILASAPANVIVDAFGLFLEPEATALSCVTSGASAAVALDTTTRNGSANAPACPAGYTRVATFNNAAGDFYNGWTTVVNDGQGYFHYNGATSVSYTVNAKCCRVPGR